MTNGINNVFDGKICQILKNNTGEMIREHEIMDISIFSKGSMAEKISSTIIPEELTPCKFVLEEDLPIENKICAKKPPLASKIDGKINNFKQGNKGDCWLLSSIKALSQIPKGAEIIKNSISQDSCGNVTVTLNGAKDEGGNPIKITMSPDELYWSGFSLSTGDDDVVAIERAVDKYRRQELLNVLNDKNLSNEDKENFVKDFDDGSNPQKALHLLTGKKTVELDPFLHYDRFSQNYFFVPKENRDAQIKSAKELLGDVKTIPTTMVFLSYDENEQESFKLGKTKLYHNHAYTVTSIEGDYVYLQNPHNTKKTIKVNMKNLFDHANEKIQNKDGTIERKYDVSFQQVLL